MFYAAAALVTRSCCPRESLLQSISAVAPAMSSHTQFCSSTENTSVHIDTRKTGKTHLYAPQRSHRAAEADPVASRLACPPDAAISACACAASSPWQRSTPRPNSPQQLRAARRCVCYLEPRTHSRRRRRTPAPRATRSKKLTGEPESSFRHH